MSSTAAEVGATSIDPTVFALVNDVVFSIRLCISSFGDSRCSEFSRVLKRMASCRACCAPIRTAPDSAAVELAETCVFKIITHRYNPQKRCRRADPSLKLSSHRAPTPLGPTFGSLNPDGYRLVAIFVPITPVLSGNAPSILPKRSCARPRRFS